MDAEATHYSMVVDWLGSHPYQAEVLLFTLEQFAGVARERMVVQCTSRVPRDVHDALDGEGYTVATIEPYLDQTYCNKIAQLDFFIEHRERLEQGTPRTGGPDAHLAERTRPSSGVFLFDLDVAVVAPLAPHIPNPDAVCGKIVDGDNPSLERLARLFDAAGLETSATVPSDWEGRGETLSTNLNGGFLYIPHAQLEPVRTAWRHWAEFLHARPHLFDHPSARRHTDQIAFAMALTAEDIPCVRLTSNWNYPAHKARSPRTFMPDAPLRAIHYHDRLDRFGLIGTAAFDSGPVAATLARVNRALGCRDRSMFVNAHRKHLAIAAIGKTPATPASKFSEAFVARSWIGDRKRRLILHAGTPKTGTSSLQRYLGAHRRELADAGWWYPEPSDTPEPKHQALNSLLRRGDADALVRYVEAALLDMPDTAHTVMFTTEGIFNHWWDYGAEAKGLLRTLAALFDFELCVWFRPPEDFAAALYAQYLRNPRRAAESMGNVYGRDIDFAAAMADPWFRGHLDYLGFYHEACALFGRTRVKPFAFEGDTVRTFLLHYGLDGTPEATPRRNQSFRRLGVDLMRIANRLALDDETQARVADLVRDIDTAAAGRTEPFALDADERTMVRQYAALGWQTLQDALLRQDAPLAKRRPLKPKVFCIGFHKTGTKSIGQALRLLGYRVAGPTGAKNPEIAEHATVIGLALATEHDAFNDNPWPLLYQTLDATFPGSRFVLTVRDEQRWMASVLKYFGAKDTPMRRWIYGAGTPLGNEATYLERYRRHNAEVLRYFQGRTDLLVLDLEQGHGWAELCGFLRVPMPDEAFPHLNRS